MSSSREQQPAFTVEQLREWAECDEWDHHHPDFSLANFGRLARALLDARAQCDFEHDSARYYAAENARLREALRLASFDGETLNCFCISRPIPDNEPSRHDEWCVKVRALIGETDV